MTPSFSRRRLLQVAPLTLPAASLLAAPDSSPVPELYPAQPREMVQEMVSVSHGNAKRVKELVEAHPSLAKASWDWGFGDWETALGAASHVGNHEIAEYLLAHGAPPTIFSATMMGHLDIVKAMIAAQPGLQKFTGPHSISLLAHAKNGGPAAVPVLRYLETLEGAGGPPPHPMTAEELQPLAGTYTFGSAPNQKIEVAVAKNGAFQFTRTGTTTRGLVPLGGNTFHPIGASAVRIRFTPAAGGMTLTIHDPDVVLTAHRS